MTTVNFEAIVFPGQGAQKLGMAQDFVEKYDESAAVFEKAQTSLPFDVAEVCFKQAELLNQTEFTQPCIVTAEIAMFEALKKVHGLNPSYFAGHSLGEYAALVAAGVMSLELALILVHRRGQLMQNVSVDGGMHAVIMDEIPLEQVKKTAAEYGIDVANDNSIQQVVLSGAKDDLEKVSQLLAGKFSELNFRYVPLNVSAPFHSRAMKGIESEFRQFLSEHEREFNLDSLDRVASNYLGGFYQRSSEQLIDALACQLSGSVRWRDNMAVLLAKTNAVLELGPNRPLRGFFNTLGVDITSIINLRNLSKVVA